ncbi:MAG TPA: hypothetical protein V6D04_06275, partial [Candidatus Obscuribacterales bacterium]
ISLYDPIISADGDVTLGDYTGAALKIEATGSITAGNIQITSPDFTFSSAPANADQALLASSSALILRAGVTTLEETTLVSNPSPTPPFDYTDPGSGTTFTGTAASSPATITVGNIDTFGFGGETVSQDGGPVVLTAPGDIKTGGINTYSLNASRTANGGDVQITSAAGSVTTQLINTFLQTSGGGGFVGKAGDVNISAATGIATDAINASASATEVDGTASVTGGQVTLQTLNPDSNISFASIDTQATTDAFDGNVGQGGAVQVLARGLVQGTGTVMATGDTINSGGTTAGGSITVQHNGGPNNVDFVVGDPTINGTAAGLNAGPADIIAVGNSFPVLPSDGSASGTPAGVQIVSINTAPTITTPSLLSGAQQDQPFTFTFSATPGDLNSDGSTDNTTVLLDSVLTGTLQRGSTVLGPGDVLVSGETLVYTPPAGTSGSLDVLRIKSSDRVSLSSLAAIAIDVQAPTPPPDPIPTPTPTPIPIPTPIPTPVPIPTPIPTPTPVPTPT